MRRTWEWLGLNLGKRAGTVAICGLLVTLGLGFGITTLRFTTSNSDYLNKNDPAWINNVNYEKVFGGDPMAVLFTMKPGTTVDNLLTKHNQAAVPHHLGQAGEDPWVFSAVTPMDALQFAAEAAEQPHRQPTRQPRLRDSPGSHLRRQGPRRQAEAGPLPDPGGHPARQDAARRPGPLQSQVDGLRHPRAGRHRSASRC